MASELNSELTVSSVLCGKRKWECVLEVFFHKTLLKWRPQVAFQKLQAAVFRAISLASVGESRVYAG